MEIIEIPDNEPRKQKDFIGFDDMTEIKEFTDEPVEENKNEKIFYLDDNNNFVPKEQAVKSVIQVYDDNGVMIEEIWSTLKEEPIQIEEDNAEYKTVFVDENENEVDESNATHIEFRKYVDGKLVSKDSFPLTPQSSSVKL